MPTLTVTNQSTLRPSLPFSLFVSASCSLLPINTTLSQHYASPYLPLLASRLLSSCTYSTSNCSTLSTSLSSSSFVSASSTLLLILTNPSQPFASPSLYLLTFHLTSSHARSAPPNSLQFTSPPYGLSCTFSITVFLPLAITETQLHSLTVLIDLSSRSFLHFSPLTAPTNVSATHNLFPLSYSIYHCFLPPFP